MKTVVKNIIKIKMYIYNSSQSLVEYLNNLQFSTIYVENCAPALMEGNVKLTKSEAVNFLIGSASVGNKTIGIFNKMPDISLEQPLRGVCLFISTKLPDDILLPTFFCRYPSEISGIFPKAMKVSVDAGMPVQIVISANALHNYTDAPFPLNNQDRTSPYLHPNSYPPSRDIAATEQKLKEVYHTLRQNAQETPMPTEMAFELSDKAFPEYLFPLDIQEQKDAYRGMKSVTTTNQSAAFLHHVLNKLMRLNITINTDLPAVSAETEIYLCPGCPFAAIHTSLNLSHYMVFTSVACEALYKLYKLYPATLTEYIGMISRKLNAPTLFIGNISDLPVTYEAHMENNLFIFLQDIPMKSPFPLISHPSKLKAVKNTTFPYSCNNIKRYSTIKVKSKKCKCANMPAAPCVEGSHCPAFYRGEEKMKINEALCTGCRSCIPHCPGKALS